MGLFNKEDEHKEIKASIKPIVVRTSNVAKELLQASTNFKVSVRSLDFNLLDTQTFCKTTKEGTAEEWIELSSDEMRDLDEALFLNPRFELKQVYEIEIFSITEPTPFDTMDISIGGNSTLCKIYLTIKAGSIARYYDRFQEDFLQLVNKKKLRANMMIGLFDSVMLSNLSALLAKIRVQEVYRFETQERYLIAQGYEPVPTVNDTLILHYDAKRKNMDEHGRIDYAKRGYVISTVADELLIEYIKPHPGENGRNCRGEFIAPTEPVVKFEPTFTIGEKIKVIDTPKSIEYRAGTGGYVTFEGGMYDIKTEVDVKEISFKTTGSIDTQLDADVSINVTEKDSMKDAIGIGMEVTVNVINIDGNIGSNAKVTAKKATVEGQVHQSATISADELTINIHKGTAYGKIVNITRLEQGTVEAEKVFIRQATGGKIRAREITIELLGSHVKMTASHKIEITNLHGGENLFVIDPLLDESIDVLSKQTKLMEETKHAIQEIKRELVGYEHTWQENASLMEDIKRKLVHYKQNGIKMPSAFVEKYQQHLQFKEKLDELRASLKTKEDHYSGLSEKRAALQSGIFEARIINHDSWRNHNEIIFKLIDPPVNIMYIPGQHEEEHILGLHEDEEGEFSIKVLSK
ncbi:flagellar assembly protein A [Sulfuricurvum sp.]|uniref:flagellar assembly protein A n=1 Tax=Sulfuricurvum sp. TaxID=2025608 RepID=UPI003C3A23F2